MIIPNAERAIIDIEKLRDYCLNTEHPRGRHKARVFASVLGLRADNAETLHTSLLRAVQSNVAIATDEDTYGQRYTLDFSMRTDVGQAVIRSNWIIRSYEDFPRLTSCFIR